ncbi:MULTISPECIES: hypothetical protein [Cytobacillus]|nr:hypothetical protein [Cytobacillus oceanisediminis]MCM3402820.1 hypothetical protein [Cytobacillus oceanisediminis]
MTRQFGLMERLKKLEKTKLKGAKTTFDPPTQSQPVIPSLPIAASKGIG